MMRSVHRSCEHTGPVSTHPIASTPTTTSTNPTPTTMLTTTTPAFLPLTPIPETPFRSRKRRTSPKRLQRARAPPRALDSLDPPNAPRTPAQSSQQPPRPSLPSEADAPGPAFAAPPPPRPPPPTGRPRRDSDGDDPDLPPDLRAALLHGSLSASALQRYRAQLRNPFLAFLLSIPAFRTRALADPAFLFKLLVQELVGNGTALASEIVVRGKEIVHELEYVASDLIVGTVVEAAFVWLLAPTLALPHNGGAFAKFLNSLPAHVFQPSGLASYSIPLRLASFVYAGLQYAMIGFVAGVVGTGITYGLIEGRKKLDTGYRPERPLPDVLPNSFGWAAFMVLSSNPRFQLVEGLELLFRKICPVATVVNGGIVTLRFLNNYWGGVQFIQFFRFLGLQPTGDEHEQHEH